VDEQDERVRAINQWIEEHWPKEPTDPTICRHCGKQDDNLLPVGVKNHIWLHSECWGPWLADVHVKAAKALGFWDVDEA
jgi:hypothetical protein